MSAFELANHVIFHYNRPLKCSQCDLYYSSEEDLSNRSFAKLKRVENGSPHQCSITDLTSVKFNSKTLYFWRCHFCSEMFSTDAERNLHELTEHCNSRKGPPRKKYHCRTCISSSFRNLAEWRLHQVLEHPSVAAMSCYYCDVTFQSKTKEGTDFFDEAAMITHVKEGHSLPKITPAHLLRLAIDCLLCGATFNSEKGLNGHMSSIHGLSKCQSFGCPVCPWRRSQRTHVHQHLAAVHMTGEGTRLLCDRCVYSTVDLMRLDEHKLAEHGIAPESRALLKCSKEGCSFQSVQKFVMDRHLIKEHGAERKHKCRFCGKGFLNSSQCRGHEEIHLNASLKPHQCEICGNSFAQKNSLYIHKRLSHQNRPFASTHKKKPPRKKPPISRTLPEISTGSVSSVVPEQTPILNYSKNESQSMGYHSTASGKAPPFLLQFMGAPPPYF